jgi:hypothetical protein
MSEKKMAAHMLLTTDNGHVPQAHVGSTSYRAIAVHYQPRA